ncbi:MAG: sugar transferase [bacterium]
MIKRCFDFTVSLIGLLLLFPVFLIISLLIRFASGPTVFFRQIRVGKDGKTFSLIKFRTMEFAPGVEKGEFEPGSNCRVTPVGRFIRKAKLDELPQLVNVLKGDMSIVGPRPEVLKWVAVYPERWVTVHRVRPGITDPASLVYRNEEEILATAPEPEIVYRDVILPHKLTLYEKYVGSHSFFGDFGIIIKTFCSIIKS